MMMRFPAALFVSCILLVPLQGFVVPSYKNPLNSSNILPSGGASCTYSWPWVTPTSAPYIQPNSCSGSGLPAKARWDAGTPFVMP